MKYFSLFSGIGGFELGIENSCESHKGEHQAEDSRSERGLDIRRVRVKATCIGFSELDKYAIQIYSRHFPDHRNYGDATEIIPRELPDFDLLTAGFPCQSFSIAGKRRGFEDTRGTLFFEICRVAREKQPRLLLLENVKGLLSHDNGSTFHSILSSMDELGYDLQWQVLNSKDFGVPQNRERVFIIGHLRGTSRPKVFPIGEGDQPVIQEGNEQPISGTISTKNQSGQANWDGSTTLIEVTKGASQGMRVYKPEGLATAVASQAGGLGAKTGLYMVSRPHGFNEGGEREFPNVRYSSIQNESVSGIRRLTPLECERLQSFPDGWTEGVSDTQRYKCLGNALTVNVVREIAKRIINL